MNVLLRELPSTRLVPHLCLSNILSCQFGPSSVLYWHGSIPFKDNIKIFTLNTCLLFFNLRVLCVSFKAWRFDFFYIHHSYWRPSTGE